MNKTKALTLLSTVKTGKEKAEQYFPRIKNSLWIKLINFKESIDSIKDQISDLENFSLDTNINKGIVAMDKDECEKRFSSILDKKFELSLLEAEYKAKKETFEEYFGESNL